jgi:fermentation-respiration switch protein FrsA (DUF1100 family)
MLKALLVVVLAYAAAALAANLVADSLIFPAPPSSYGPGQGLLLLPTASGGRVAACWLPVENAGPDSPVILYSHGNAEDLGHVLPWLHDLRRRGYSVLGYDYPGYGQSPGQPSEAGACEAIDAAWDWLTGTGPARSGGQGGDGPGIDPWRVLVHGYSLGGGPSAHLAARASPGGLILESTFTTAFRVMTRVDLFPGDRFRTVDALGRVRCPVLVLHGGLDRVVPPAHGRELFARAREPRQSLFVPGAGHEDLHAVAGEEYWRALAGFAESCGLAPGR